jgi:hypothetical protein
MRSNRDRNPGPLAQSKPLGRLSKPVHEPDQSPHAYGEDAERQPYVTVFRHPSLPAKETPAACGDEPGSCLRGTSDSHVAIRCAVNTRNSLKNSEPAAELWYGPQCSCVVFRSCGSWICAEERRDVEEGTNFAVPLDQQHPAASCVSAHPVCASSENRDNKVATSSPNLQEGA